MKYSRFLVPPLMLALALVCGHALAAGDGAAASAESSASAAPSDGDAAPAFRLQDQKGHWHSLGDYEGRWLVLYFYPKDFTPGCTTEVCAFRDDIVALRKAGAEVVGVSLDDVASHADFAKKYHVPFPLLSDADQDAAKRYGVLAQHGDMTYARRETFLIDPHGRIAKHYPDVDPEKNVKQVMADLATLKEKATPETGD
jgi:peroxiredoxin Q/BCP